MIDDKFHPEFSTSEGSYALEDPPVEPARNKVEVVPTPPSGPRKLIWIEPIRVAGISQYVTDMSQVQGNDVWLEREPENPYHAQAIAIYLVGQLNGIETKTKIGYVPRDLASMVFDYQLPVRGRIEWKGVGASGLVGMRILA